MLEQVLRETREEFDSALARQLASPDGTIELQPSDKAYLLRAARIALEKYLLRQPLEATDFSNPPAAVVELNAKVFITLCKHDQTLGCIASSGSNLLDATIKSVRKSAKDQRWPEQVSRANLRDTRIELEIVLGEREIEGRTNQELRENIALGLDALRVRKGDKTAMYKSALPIKRGWTSTQALRRLCRKAGLEPNDFLEEDCTISAARSYEFGEDFRGRFEDPVMIEKMRSRPVVFQSEVDRFSLEKSLLLIHQYLHRNTTARGRLTYEYDLLTHEKTYSTDAVATIRKLATTWAMADIGRRHSSPVMRRCAKLVIDRIAHQSMADDLYIMVKKQATLGNQAFLLAALVTLREPEYRPGLIERSIELILDLEDRSGGFIAAQILPKRDDGTSKKQIYYSGEGLTALALAAESRKDNSLFDVHKRVLPFYERMFDNIQEWINMTAWHSKAYASAFRKTGDEDYARWVLKMIDRLVERQKVDMDSRVDYCGSFGASGNSCATAVLLEGVVEGYSVAKILGDEERLRVYGRSLYLGMRYLLSRQISERHIHSLEKGSRAIGGFETSILVPSIRIDNLQHAYFAIRRFLDEVEIGY